jgi:hypothetical protein
MEKRLEQDCVWKCANFLILLFITLLERSSFGCRSLSSCLSGLHWNEFLILLGVTWPNFLPLFFIYLFIYFLFFSVYDLLLLLILISLLTKKFKLNSACYFYISPMRDLIEVSVPPLTLPLT